MSDVDYTTERWLPVAMPGYQDFYDVSDYGRVRSRRRNMIRVLRPHILHDGYHNVALTRPVSIRKDFGIHRLVATAFIGPPPTDKHDVAHNDGVPNNNHVSNLRWATRKENMADMALHGTILQGEKNPHSKLSDVDVVNIHKLRESGLLQREIAKQYGMCQSRISYILSGRGWSHLSPISNKSLNADGLQPPL